MLQCIGAAVNIGVNGFENGVFWALGYNPASGPVSSLGTCNCGHLRKFRLVFHQVCNSQPSHPQDTGIPFCPAAFQHLLAAFFTMALLARVKWYLTVPFICIGVSDG